MVVVNYHNLDNYLVNGGSYFFVLHMMIMAKIVKPRCSNVRLWTVLHCLSVRQASMSIPANFWEMGGVSRNALNEQCRHVFVFQLFTNLLVVFMTLSDVLYDMAYIRHP